MEPSYDMTGTIKQFPLELEMEHRTLTQKPVGTFSTTGMQVMSFLPSWITGKHQATPS